MSFEVISTNNAPSAIGPYSQAVKANNMVYVSGQIPLNVEGKLVEGGADAQAYQVLDNLKAVLQAAGTSLENVIKTTVFLKDLNNFAAVNKVYGEYFKEPYPARACVQVAKLPLDVEVEIDAIATI